jgi:2,3-bisphosphoglycerate-dependent phosphoglycerate mutase
MTVNRPREVWFIRHGESLANAGARTMEASGYGLTELGARQAEQVAAALSAEPDLIIHSPYVRARQTALPAIERFADVPVEEWPVQEVQYLDPAKCAGTTQDERRAMSLEYWERCDPEHTEPNAESFVVFIDRARQSLAGLAQRSEGRTVVFCHGQFMSAVAWLLLSRPAFIDQIAMRRFYQFIHGYAVPNCSVMPVFFHGDGTRSLGGLWLPHGVDVADANLAGGLAGV